MSILGIDVGTTGCKAAVFNAKGKCLSQAYREYAPSHPRPGWAQLDAKEVWSSVQETIRQAASGLAAAGGEPIVALSVSSMGEAAAAVTRDRAILGPSILFFDLRGQEYIDRLCARISPEDFYGINANMPGPSYTLPKLCWLRDHEPELYRHADYFLLWADAVLFLLGGEPVACHSLASRTLLFDLRKEDWSDALLEAVGLERGKLGRCVGAGKIVGRINPTMAAQLHLPQNVVLVSGGHDQCCNALGAGIGGAGQAVCGIGTFECITPVLAGIPDLKAMQAAGLSIEHHVVPGLYVTFVYNQSGALVRWFRDTFASADRRHLDAGADIYNVLAAEMPADPTRLLVLPHFQTTGPPDFLTDSAGVLAGLKDQTTRGEILKAMMEGATYYLAQNVHALRATGFEPVRFIATGGGAKSDAWLRIKADIFGVPFARPAVTEASVLGAAMLAGVAAGVFDSLEQAVKQLVRIEQTFEPDAARHAIYRRRLEQYSRLYPAMQGLLRELHAEEPA